jgi:hypothetical protein
LNVAVAIGVVVSLLAACSSGSAAFPTGKWTATNKVDGSVGAMEYRSDGTWTFTGGGSLVSHGTYKTDASTITFTTDLLCKTKNAEQATYAWTHADDRLTLTKQADSCISRVAVLDGRVWEPAS